MSKLNGWMNYYYKYLYLVNTVC